MASFSLDAGWPPLSFVQGRDEKLTAAPPLRFVQGWDSKGLNDCRFTTEQWLPNPVEHVFRFFADPRNLERISPPEVGARLVAARLARPRGTDENTHGLAGAGSELTISLRLVSFLPFRAIWKARIIEFEWNRYFRDVQVEGPFRRFDHRHEVEVATRNGVAGTRLRDMVDYSIGFGPAGYFLDPTIVRVVLQRMFDYRHTATAQLLAH